MNQNKNPSPARPRVYAEVSPELKAKLDRVLVRGDRQFLIELLLTELVEHIEGLEPITRTYFFGSLAEKRRSILQFSTAFKELSDGPAR